MKQGQFPAVLPLSSLDGHIGFKIDGEMYNDSSSYSLAALGDFNDDGVDDFIIGAPYHNNDVGCSYVVFGGTEVGNNGLISLSKLDGSNGFKLDGETGKSGTSVSSGGDFNNDGIPDLFIGAPTYNSARGRNYLVFGGATVGNAGLFSLSKLNGTNGLKIDGENDHEFSGWPVSAMTDLNGDGYTDLLIGAVGYNSHTGRSYVVFGGPKVGNTGSFMLASLNGTGGFKIDGEVAEDYSGYYLATGDINGDHYSDLLIGARYHNNDTGCSYVVFGRSGINGISLSSLNGTDGFKIYGENAGDKSGASLSVTGNTTDFNGDGYADFFVGSPGYNSGTGRNYVIFGGPEVGKDGVLLLSDLNGKNGFKIDGEMIGDNTDWGTNGVSDIADINGDGYADLLIGALDHNGYTGRSYVVFGGSQVGSNGLLLLSELNGVNGFKIDGENPGDYCGDMVSRAGDINDDGISDFLIGAVGYNNSTGRTYVIFGDVSPVLVNNQLHTSMGASTTLNATYLSAYDVNHPNDTLVFILSGVTHGRFEMLSNPGIALANFTQQQVSDDDIQFVHDGTLIAPGYSITVRSTGIAWTGPNLARITFTGVQPSLFPAMVQLGDLNGQTGFKLDGENNGDYSGSSVGAAGDVNGDGYVDLVVGADGYPGGSAKGRSYVVFGGPEVGSNGTLLLSSLNGVNGFKLDGENNSDQSGWPVSAAGDINGDSYADFIIGASYYPSHNRTGRSYVVFGGPDVGSNGTLALLSLNGTNGFKLDGENNYDWSSSAISAAGDINGDSYADFIIGASYYPSNNRTGRSYVVFGGSGVGSNGTLALLSLNGTNGFKLDGENNGDDSGASVSAAGDINGDGYVDLVIGAGGYPANNQTGRSYVVFGGSGVGSGGVLALSSLNGMNGFKLDGENNGDDSGVSVSTAGDINGDGYVDLVIGADGYSAGSLKGRSYVVFGGPGVGSGGTLALSSLNGTNGFKLDGENNNDYSGFSVSTAGDINGDGYADLVIGAVSYPADNWTGRIYVVFGAPGIGSGGTLALSSLNGVNGFKLDGENDGDCSGYSVSTAGDINGDGIVDLVIGANRYPKGNSTGRTYVVFGDVAPQLITNNLIINQNQTLILSSINLNSTDVNHPAASLRFNATQIEYGYFSLVNTTQPIITFNQSQLWNNQIQFVHDGSSQLPNYQIQVQSDGLALPPLPATVNITFYRQPVFVANQLSVLQGETVLFTSSMLDVSDDYPDAEVSFLIENLQHAQFEFIPNGNSSTVQFTQEQVKTGQIQFVHDNTSSAPSYNVTVSDEFFTVGPQAATIYFNGTPGELEQSSISLGVILGVALGGAAVIVAGCLYAGYQYRQNKGKTKLHLQSTHLSFPLLEETPAEVPSIALQDLKYDETKSCIGNGAYASVYRGVYQDNPVAIKQLHAHHISSKALKEFKQEAGIMASMSSEFIVQLRGVCFEPPTACIIMELMPKYSLYQLLSNSPNLPLPVLLQMGLDVIHGLQDLHIKNILHRDLKSLNVLLDDRLRAKVSDFGMSKLQSEIGSGLSSQAGIKGTLLWAAPELFDEKPKYSKAADIYAYGLILWELMVKPYRTPFSNVDLVYEGLRREKLKRKDQEEISSDWSKPLAKLMRECWDKKPHKRPSAEIVAKSLGQIFTAEQKTLKQLIRGPGGPIAIDSGVPLIVSENSNSRVNSQPKA